MAFRPDLSNRREHYGTNCCKEQGDFSDGDWIYFHKQQQSNHYATSRVRLRQHPKMLRIRLVALQTSAEG